MATGTESKLLTDVDLARLATKIGVPEMKKLALGYLGIDKKTIKIMYSEREDSYSFNTDMLVRWRNKRSVNSRQKLADLLRRAAVEEGLLNYEDVAEILEKEKANVYVYSELDRAYIYACKEGTKKVFNARIILAGYSEAGKTSLAHRLLGEKFNGDEQRTEGIALHRIESTFNRKKEQTKGGKWGKKDLNIVDLLSEFNYEVKKRIKKGESESSTEENDVVHDDSPKHAKNNSPEDATSLDAEHSQTVRIFPLSEKDKNKIMGAIPRQESAEKTPFAISLWDLGGQDEFIATHHLFLNTEATIVIVMDITKGMHQLVGKEYVFGDINSVVESFDYWLNLFHTDASKFKRKPNIAIVLTHIDQIEGNQDEYIKNYTDNIMGRIKSKPYAKYININNIYPVDNTAVGDSVFQVLRNQLLKHLSNQNTWGLDMPLTWFKLKAEILLEAKQKTQKYLYLHEVWELGEKIGMNTDAVESFLKRQTALGDLVYFSDLRDLIITDPQWLVDKCKALISPHEFIDRREGLPENLKTSLKKGKITESGLKQLWNNDGVVFLIKLMEKFDLLVDVSDESCRKYVIPCLLPSSETEIKQQGVKLKLFTDTFPQLVSKCSKIKNWKLSWDNLSFTTATFHIGRDVRLDLWLSSFREAQTRIWCSDDSDHRNTRSEIRAILEGLLEPNENETITFGYKKLTDVMLWNLSKKLTTQSDVRTLAYELGMTGSDVDRCFTNHQYDISNATHAVLTQWKVSEFSERVAYKKLCEALEKVQMNALIYQALVERPL